MAAVAAPTPPPNQQPSSDSQTTTEDLYTTYLGVSFAVFLSLLPKPTLSLLPTLQCRNRYLSLRLRQAEEELSGLKSRRQEDSKANARVVEIFASHRNGWQREERKLLQRLEDASEEVARLRGRVADLERSEAGLLAEIDEMKTEISERDELLNFMSAKTASSHGFGEARVSEAGVGLLFGDRDGFDPDLVSSMASQFWSQRDNFNNNNPWQDDVQYAALDTTYQAKHFVARRESPWKVDGESKGVVPSKLQVLEQELSNLERLGKGEFSKAPSLLRKQAKRYQDIAGKIDDLCRRMQGGDPCDTSLNPEFRTQRQTEYLLEAVRLQQRAAETGQKLVDLQAEISSAYSGDELGYGTKIPTRRSLDCIRNNFKDIQRNLEIWLARIIGDLEGILSRDGASRVKEIYISRCHYV